MHDHFLQSLYLYDIKKTTIRWKIFKRSSSFICISERTNWHPILHCWYSSAIKKFSHTSDKRDHFGILYVCNWGSPILRSNNISYNGANYCTVSITFWALSLIQTKITDGVSGKQAFILLFFSIHVQLLEKAMLEVYWCLIIFCFLFCIFHSNNNIAKLILAFKRKEYYID